MPIKIDVEKAKETHKDKIRQVRSSLFETKDIEYMRAMESGNVEKQSNIVAEKQALRDATTIVDNFTIESDDVLEVTAQLKQVWDEDLLGSNPLV